VDREELDVVDHRVAERAPPVLVGQQLVEVGQADEADVTDLVGAVEPEPQRGQQRPGAERRVDDQRRRQEDEGRPAGLLLHPAVLTSRTPACTTSRSPSGSGRRPAAASSCR